MDETEIRKYAKVMEEYSLEKLEITGTDCYLSIKRHVGTKDKSEPRKDTLSSPSQSELEIGDTSEEVVVKSPLVGIFYAAPAENAEPYVSLGDSVHKGQTLCIVEAMKLMNEIEAECDGTIAEICATNGQAVESGTELFRVEARRHE